MGGDPAARPVYDDMRRRLSKEERDAALLAAATAKAQREAEAKRIADEASRKALAAKASEAKLARIAPIAAKGPIMRRPSASATRPVAGVDTPVTSLKIPTGAAQPTRAEPWKRQAAACDGPAKAANGTGEAAGLLNTRNPGADPDRCFVTPRRATPRDSSRKTGGGGSYCCDTSDRGKAATN